MFVGVQVAVEGEGWMVHAIDINSHLVLNSVNYVLNSGVSPPLPMSMTTS